MAKAAAKTKKNPVAKKSAAADKKSKVIEEVVLSSSDESDFDEYDDIPDSAEVPSGSKNLEKISKISEFTPSKVGSPSVIPPKREGLSTPRASPIGIKKQAPNMAKGSGSAGVPIQVTPRSKAHQSPLNTAALKKV